MPLDVDNIDEICEDIAEQQRSGVSTCALFKMTLVPEGTPPVNKAKEHAEIYKLFKARLDALGISSGILVQASIGHGRKLAEPSPFTKYVGIVPNTEAEVCCPYDDSFCDHMRDVFETLAATHPDSIMLDDDFRLTARKGSGCACPLHMAEFNRMAGTNMTASELYSELCKDGGGKYSKIFIETQRASLLKAARAMREGIDKVDPKLPGSYCGCGKHIEFAEEIADILKGEGNPSVVRVNNGNYTPAGARRLSFVSYRAAVQAEHLRGKVDYLLAETDTCPQNRYSTGAQHLHSHFVASILEGASGAKHWITRLASHEPKSGAAYRKILSKNAGFYEALSALVPHLDWLGCRIPLTERRVFFFDKDKWGEHDGGDGWSTHVLERFGVPLYFSAKQGGAAFLADDADRKFTDDEIRELLSGAVFLAAKSAKRLIERGFGEYLGVDVREWNGSKPTAERLFVNGKTCSPQIGIMELVPIAEGVVNHSMVIHSISKESCEELFPGVTSYKNSLGGTVTVFSGTPITEFTYSQAFSFLNESRKLQFIKLLSETGNLPIWYDGDEEVYLRAANIDEGGLFVCLFNIGLDPIEEIRLATDKNVTRVQSITADGKYIDCPFTYSDGILTLNIPLHILNPVALILN